MKPAEHPGIGGEGWDSLASAPAPDVRGADQKQEDEDRLIARVFGNEQGKQLLALLREKFVEPAVCQPGVSADFGYYREGQRFVVIDLETRLNRATRPENDNSKRTRSKRSGRSGSQQAVAGDREVGDLPF